MKIMLIGFGVVGQSLIQLIEHRSQSLYRDWGLRPRFVGVVDSRGAAVSEHGLEGSALFAARKQTGTVAGVPGHGIQNPNVERLIEDSDADVVIEATPSTLSYPSAAMMHIQTAFRCGCHVVSINKAPLAVAMPALLELAEYNRVQLRYSGTVGGGTPVLAWAKECTRGDEVVTVKGVFNGTTNYILWRMTESGASYAEALSEAADLGYAEADPSADVDGIDAATKVVIFTNLVMGRPATMSDVSITGIRDFDSDLIVAARDRGNVIKLIGEIGDTLSVRPIEVPHDDTLNVTASLNAVTVTLRHGGDVTLVGRGAGGPETATAVLRDLLDIWTCMGGQQ